MSWGATLVDVKIDSNKRPEAAMIVYSNGEQKFLEPLPLLGVNRAAYKRAVQTRIDQLDAASDVADTLVLGPIDTTPDPPLPPTKEQQDRSDYFRALGVVQRAAVIAAIPAFAAIDVLNLQIVTDSVKAIPDLFKPEYLV